MRWLLACALVAAATLVSAQPPFPPHHPPPTDPGTLFTHAFFLKLGFSFMIGLAMGYALKIAFKVALVIFGVVLLALFVLQYNGFIQVNWSGLEHHYDGAAAWLTAHAKVFFGFVADNLASAASFATGLALGLKL